jgi:hypothetical protein
MDQTAMHRIHEAVEAAKRAAHQATIDRCRTRTHTFTLMLNSLAKSLTVAPSASETVQESDRALRLAGLPATWNQ